ncbi:MAG TPA: hypothetical protein VK988_09670 [Acidimicrobiales bacterium]|nr:hypothetical protein [Acidimicrobiales bacterium]
MAVLRGGDGSLLDAHIRRALPKALREVGVWPPVATPLQEKKRQRFAFIERLYQRTDGETMGVIKISEIGSELGWSEEAARKVALYLGEEGLVRSPAKGLVAMTHAGVVEVEAALENPEEPTVHFPALNVINVYGNVSDSQLQVGTEASEQYRATRGEE